MFRCLLLVTLLAATLPAAAAAALSNQPVRTLDLQRYTGQWHEIAHLPTYFQRKCVDTITATYTANPDGSVGVHNACRTQDGTMAAADGVAKKAGGPSGAFKVRFAPVWLRWLPWVWADYWVIELDPDYRWAVIGGPGHKYLWVLSRSATMDRALFEQLSKHARQRGYPVDQLLLTAPLR